jgi:hypothetical protein
MPLLSSFNLRLALAAVLLAGLFAVHLADYDQLVEPQAQGRDKPQPITVATVDEAVDQYIKGYAIDTYRNVFEQSNFAVNPPPPPPKPKPVKVVEPPPQIQRWRVVSIDRQRVVLRHPLGGRYEFIVNEDTLIGFEN